MRTFRCNLWLVSLALFFAFSPQLPLSATSLQVRTITGIVVDANDEPIIGATVVVTGHANTGGVTDLDGAFSIPNVPANAKTLTISFIGYKTQVVNITTKRMRVVMQEDAEMLEEVVVTGFQNLDKRTFTGSTVKLKADDAVNAGMIDISRMLEGKAAGVTVQNVSGTFGSAPKLRIRGATSIYGNNKPLWVVDGVVLEDIVNVSNDDLASGDPTTLLGSSVAGMNSNDIESIDILKDASATALYGARAMNGVIVVTTKKGKQGKPSVSYSGNYYIRQKPLYSDYNIMDSYSQMSIYSELERKGFITSSIRNSSNSGVYGKMYQLLATPDENGNYALENTVAGRRAFLERYAKANTNWFDLLFRNSMVQEHSLSMSSGTDNSRSYASVSLYDDAGWSIGESVKRYTANLRNDYSLGKYVTAGFNVSASYREQKNPGTLDRVDDVVRGEYSRDFDINPFSYAMNTSRALTAYDENGNLEYFQRNYAPFNIINELNNNNLNMRVIDLKLQGETSVKLGKGFSYSFIGNVRYVQTTNEHMVKENSNMAMAYRADANSTIRARNPFLYADPDHPNDEKQVVLPNGGFYNVTQNLLLSYDIRNQLNYKATLNKVHDLSGIAGIQVQGNDRQKNSNKGYGYQYSNGGIPSYPYQLFKMLGEANDKYYSMSQTRYRYAAMYANMEYTYDMRYALSGTLRNEGSNRAGSNERWLLTWNVGFRWNIMEEKFMKPLQNTINFMNIRASYGLSAQAPEVGNSISVYYPYDVYRPLSNDDDEPGVQLNEVGNRSLTWEKSYQLNLGYNIVLLNNAISLDVQYWQKKNYDLIDRIQTSKIVGQSTRYANYSDMRSHGWDITLGFVPVNTKKFNWRINLPFSFNTSEVTRMEYKPRIYDLTKPEGGNIVGYPLNSLFSVKFDGLDPNNGLPTFTNENGARNKYTVYMQQATPETYLQHLKYEGSVDPTYSGGINNTVRYKDFTLDLFFSYSGGNKIRLYPAFKSSYSDLDAMPNEFKNRWIMSGDERYTNIPGIYDLFVQSSVNGSYPYTTYNRSDVRVANGDFMRLKTVALTYQIPASLLAKTHLLKTASVQLMTNNVWMLYSDKKLAGQDPEFYNAGGVAQPLQRQYILSLKVGF